MDLFHLGNISEPIVISHLGYSYGTKLEYVKNEADSNFCISSGGTSTNFDNEFGPAKPSDYFSSPINPYQYKSEIQFEDVGNYLDRLKPPFGNNLGNVIKHNTDMLDLLKEFAEENNFELVINPVTAEISIQIRISGSFAMSLSYDALADTYKRMLFYIAAIRHGIGKIITLDEPDTHAFPKYVSYLADEIIAQQSKQFFITTHNPYLLNQLIEKTPAGELAVFVCSYNKTVKSTTAKRLTDADLGELPDYGVDIFFNINRYLNDNIEYSA